MMPPPAAAAAVPGAAAPAAYLSVFFGTCGSVCGGWSHACLLGSRGGCKVGLYLLGWQIGTWEVEEELAVLYSLLA